MIKGLKLFGWVVGGFVLFWPIYALSNLIFFLLEPTAPVLATIIGLIVFVLPFCLYIGFALSKRKSD